MRNEQGYMEQAKVMRNEARLHGVTQVMRNEEKLRLVIPGCEE
jgi:hypothetical protein